MKDGFINALLRLKEILLWTFCGLENICSYFISLFISLLVPYKEMISIILILSIIDWVLAVFYAYKHNNIQSTKMLGLVGKMILYGIGFLIAGSCSRFIGIELMENIVTATIFIAEIISLLANIKLVYPNVPLIRFLERIMTSELASKTGQSVEEVEQMLKDNSNEFQKRSKQNSQKTRNK